jgi:hypothetical protein
MVTSSLIQIKLKAPEPGLMGLSKSKNIEQMPGPPAIAHSKIVPTFER